MKKLVFEKGNANWIDEIESITKQYNSITQFIVQRKWHSSKHLSKEGEQSLLKFTGQKRKTKTKK